MEELKACPHCGSTNVGISPYDGAKTVVCMNCLCMSAAYRGENAEANAAAAWNRRAALENKVLTLEQLRKMDGEPVYCIGKTRFDTNFEGWKVLYKCNSSPAVIRFTDNTDFRVERYGEQFLAYARKPEGSEKP